MLDLVLVSILIIGVSAYAGHRMEEARRAPKSKRASTSIVREEERSFLTVDLARQEPARRKTDTSPHPAIDDAPQVMSTPTLARLYVSNQDQLCMWGKKPRHVPPTWLAYDHSSGLYGLSPYAMTEVVTTLEKERTQIEVTPQASNRMKRASIIRDAALRVHAEEVAFPKGDLANEYELREYQRAVLAFADATMGRFLLAYDMGLGKTPSSIAAARHLDCERVVVVTKSSAKPKWKWEVKKFDGGATMVIEGSSSEPIPPHVKWVILNYEVAEEWLSEILDWNPDMAIIDEVHWISNPKAKRSMAVKTLGLKAPYCIGLSGTPMRNRPKDLWNILDTLQPGWWGRQFEFERAFCMGRKRPITRYVRGKRITNLVWVADGVSNEDVFHERMKSVMLRKLKDEAGLPPRSRAVVPVALTNTAREEYRRLQGNLSAAFEKKNFTEVLTLVSKLWHTSSLGRVDATIDKALEIVRFHEKPVVVFSYFLDSLDRIEEALVKEKLRVGRIDGSTSSQKREEVQRAFQAGELDVFLGQVQAAGEAIDLFRADTTLHHDVTWTPFEQDQAESRVHREGQKNPTLHLYFLGEGTIDEKMLDLTIKKLQMSKSILDTGMKIDKDVLRELREEHFNAKVVA